MHNIAIVSEHASPIAPPGSVDSGGQNIYVGQIAKQLASLGYRVDVFTRLDNPFLPAEMEWEDGVRIVHVPAGPPRPVPKEALMPHMGEFSDFMQDYFLRAAPAYDLIHANFFMSAMAALPVARRMRIPLAVTFHALGKVRRRHQAEADLFPDSRFAIEEEIIRKADCIIAECPQDRRDLIELYAARDEHIRMVPCGFDATELGPVDQARARAALGWDPDAFYLLQLGRMVPRKGVDNVIRGLAHLRQHHCVNARLCIVGGNADKPEDDHSAEMLRLRALADELNVMPYVEFAGRRNRHELRQFYGAADVFVTTPWYEPFGITPVEAMACARPVIGADTGGIRYSVLDGVTGVLVPPKDPRALAARAAVLAHNPALARRMGHAGRDRVQRLFTWERVGLQLAEVFEELVRDRYPAPFSRRPSHVARSHA